jgi:V/A-type H+-transporting ATPase subunit C
LGSSKSGIGKLVLGKYPYTYARVSVMRSFLLRKEDYHKLIKMNINEMISYLESSQYKKEIDELAVSCKGVQLMDLALNRNIANTWTKLKRISPPILRALISFYLLRVDLWNLKTIIRAKYTKLDPAQLQAMVLPSGFLTEKKLAELIKKDSVEDVVKSAGIISYNYFAYAVEKFRETKSVVDIENALDRFYYSTMGEFSKRLPNEGRLFREFLESELEITTIINVLRLKRAHTPVRDIFNYVTLPKDRSAVIRGMISAQTTEDAAKLLEQSRFKAVAENGVKEFLASKSLIPLEVDLFKHLLKRSVLLIHQHPLTVDVILGYMFAKELEVRNLKLLLKVKQLGLGEQFAEQQMIMI